MKISTMLLVVVTLLAGGAAIWLHTQRNEALESATKAIAEKSASEAELKDIKQKLMTSEKAREEAEAAAKKNQAMIDVLKRNADNRSTDLKVEKAKIEDLTKSVETLKSAKAAAEKTAATLESKLKALTSDLGSTQSELASAKKDLASAQSQLAAAKSDLQSTKNDLATSKTALSAAEAARKQLEALLATEKSARVAAEQKAAAQ